MGAACNDNCPRGVPISPEIAALALDLLQERSAFDGVLRKLELANADLSKTDEAIADLEARVAEKDRELALTGAPVPEVPFEEDARLSWEKRQKRVQLLRVDMLSQQLRAVKLHIEQLGDRVRQAWCSFGRAEHAKALARFDAAALELNEDFQKVYLVCSVFQGLHLPLPELLISNASGFSANSLGGRWTGPHDPGDHELHITLQRQRQEIDRLLALTQGMPLPVRGGAEKLQEEASLPASVSYKGEDGGGVGALDDPVAQSQREERREKIKMAQANQQKAR